MEPNDAIVSMENSILASFDHSILPRQHVGRNREADLLRGFQIDHQLKLCRPFHREIARFGSLKDFVNVDGGAPGHVLYVGAIGH